MLAYDRYLKTKKLYDTNEKFHKFVNRCCETYKYDLEFAFNVLTIQDVGEYYAGERKGEDLSPAVLSCCDICDDKSC